MIDDEAVLLSVDGISDFNGRNSRRHDIEVELYAFDMLVSDGEDLRKFCRRARATLDRLPDRYLSPASIEGMQSKF